MHVQLCTFLLLVSPILLNAAPADTTEAYNRVTVTIELPKPTQIVAIRLDYVTFPDVGEAYKIHDELLTWNEANERCKSEYGYLATADTPGKIAHINSLRNSDQRSNSLHVGIRKSDTTNAWVRVDNGLPVTSLPWSPLNPNPTEDCAGLPASGNTLVSYPCNKPAGEKFVCGVTLTATWHQ